jgi:hypothetical protein
MRRRSFMGWSLLAGGAASAAGCVLATDDAPAPEPDPETAVQSAALPGFDGGLFPWWPYPLTPPPLPLPDAGLLPLFPYQFDLEAGVPPLPDPIGCAPGLVSCGGGPCVDLTSDPANCGVCGLACASGYLCAGAGMCLPQCLPMQTACGGGCVYASLDPRNCGACGNACATGQICSYGTCWP